MVDAQDIIRHYHGPWDCVAFQNRPFRLRRMAGFPAKATKKQPPLPVVGSGRGGGNQGSLSGCCAAPRWGPVFSARRSRQWRL